MDPKSYMRDLLHGVQNVIVNNVGPAVAKSVGPAVANAVSGIVQKMNQEQQQREAYYRQNPAQRGSNPSVAVTVRRVGDNGDFVDEQTTVAQLLAEQADLLKDIRSELAYSNDRRRKRR